MKTAKQASARMQDMTVGDPLKLLIAFAMPMLIGNLFQQVYTMIDTMEMGYFVGDDAISAVGAVSALYNLLMSLVISMNNGFAIPVTQAFGSHNEKRLRRSIAGMLILNGALVVIATTLSVVFLTPMLHFMNIPEGIFEQSFAYMLILSLGLFTTVGYNMFSSILRAVGNSRTPLYVLVVSSLTNIALDLFFIIVLGLGVVGTALGTVLAQALSAVLCGGTLLRKYQAILPERGDWRASQKLWPELLSSGFAMALMLCVVNVGTLIFQRANNALGETLIAAYAAARKIIEAFMTPSGTLAAAASTFVSQNWGARRYDRIRQGLRIALVLEVIWGLIACALGFAVGEFMVRLITGTQSTGIIEGGTFAIHFSLPFFAVLGVLLCLRTAMQSMGYKAAPVISSCVELAMKFLAASFLIPVWGYIGTCATEPVTWVLMTAYLGGAYFIRRKKMYPEEDKLQEPEATDEVAQFEETVPATEPQA